MVQDSSLLRCVTRLAELLSAHGEERWADQLDEEAKLIGTCHPLGIGRFLQHFGGVGSLNDVVLRPKEADDQFVELREQAWDEATKAFGSEMLRTSFGVFEVDWWIGTTGTLSIGLDPDAGFADLPEIIDVASASDVAAALRQVGVPSDEAESLAPALWERRWRGPDGVA